MNRATNAAFNHLARFKFYRLRSPSQYTCIRDLLALEEALPMVLERVVADARAAGWTWAEVGEALGVSRDTARKRFGA